MSACLFFLYCNLSQKLKNKKRGELFLVNLRKYVQPRILILVLPASAFQKDHEVGNEARTTQFAVSHDFARCGGKVKGQRQTI